MIRGLHMGLKNLTRHDLDQLTDDERGQVQHATLLKAEAEQYHAKHGRWPSTLPRRG